RRHTRWPRDWSSDVCSSDLDRLGDGGRPGRARLAEPALERRPARPQVKPGARAAFTGNPQLSLVTSDQLWSVYLWYSRTLSITRSEERRVGKEGSVRGWREE